MKEDNDFESTYDDIKKLILESRKRIYTAVNIELLNLYWLIGKEYMICKMVRNVLSMVKRH